MSTEYDEQLDRAVMQFTRDIGVATLSASHAERADTVAGADKSIKVSVEQLKLAIQSHKDKAIKAVLTRVQEELDGELLGHDYEMVKSAIESELNKLIHKEKPGE